MNELYNQFMSIALTWSSLTSTQQQQLKKKYQCQSMITQYQPQPQKYNLYETDISDDAVYLPLLAWRDYLKSFPTTHHDYPKLKLPPSPISLLYTPETDPLKQGRHQQEIVALAEAELNRNHSTFISASPGYGKCFGKGTMILTYNKGPIPIETIQPGDYLISEEEKLTQVVGIADGIEAMCEIELAPHETLTVNLSHILTLYQFKNSNCTLLTEEWNPARVIDVSVQEFLTWSPDRQKKCKTIIRSNTQLPLILQDHSLYFKSVWEAITIIQHDVEVNQSDWLTHLRFFDWKFRDHVFWGLVFKFGTPHKCNYYIRHSHSSVLYAFMLLARSLGYMSFYADPHQLIIRSTKRTFHAVFSPTIKLLPPSTYYGLTLYPHERFLLESYTVVHNTRMGVHLALHFRLPTAILCHFDTVRQQWIETIHTMTHHQAKIQEIHGQIPIDPTADFYLVGIEKGSRCSRDDLEHVGTVIIDEAHVCTLKAFTKTLFKSQPLYLIGLSATPERADGMSQIFNFYFDPKTFIVRNQLKTWTVHKIKTQFTPTIEYTMARGKSVRNWSLMIQSIEENPDRWQMIADLTLDFPNDKILILSNRTAQTIGIHQCVSKYEESALYYGRMKQDKTKRVTCCGMKKGGVGMDDPAITLVILASDAKDVQQFIGRVRQSHVVIIDIVDRDYAFENHWRLRREFYKSLKAEIIGDDTPSRGNREPSVRLMD